MKKNNSPIRIILYLLLGLLFVLSWGIVFVFAWVYKSFNIGFAEFVHVLAAPLQGTADTIINEVVWSCVPAMAAAAFIFFLLVDMPRYVGAAVTLTVFKKPLTVRLDRFSRHIPPILTFFSLALAALSAELTLDISTSYKQSRELTTFFEDHYVDPANVSVAAPSGKKNLILIYLESMETSFASKDVGGLGRINYIPSLTRLAQRNISFSNTDKLGGFSHNSYTSWTMAGIFSSSSGLPFRFPVDNNEMESIPSFAPTTVMLGDILARDGYNSMFMCGSDASFGGREHFFNQHGYDEIYDLSSARMDEVIPFYYHVWWGFEDEILYGAAKTQLTRLAEEDEPFNLTMLTVDTHNPDGYVCGLCKDEFPAQLANVVSCADRQLADFVGWCSEQPFYEDTVIVVMGDHLSRDDGFFSNLSRKNRSVYNCIINSAREPASPSALVNREFLAMDMFPTILSALGYEIEGSRLGLGTDMFSGEATLAESLGLQYVSDEIGKFSPYFINRFYLGG